LVAWSSSLLASIPPRKLHEDQGPTR